MVVLVPLLLGDQPVGAATSSSEFLGVWRTQDGEADVLLYQEKGVYFGKVVWLKHPTNERGEPRKDERHPVSALRSRPLLGLVILRDFTPRDGELVDGTLYDPTDGATYSCKMWLEGRERLKVRGYQGLLYETETWTRAKGKQ